MKRQTQQTGVRKYFGDDLIELQSEPLRALDAIFTATGACVISGCEITTMGDKFDIAAGIVALHATDLSTDTERIMVMPFTGVKDVLLPVYLVAECDVVERVYGDGRVKPIAYNYFAAVSGVKPTNAPSLEVGAAGALRFADAMQAAMAKYATVTIDEKASWNAKESTAGAQAKADGALRSANTYADTAIAALVNGSPAALDTLRELADALGGDSNFATTVMNAIGERVTIAAFNAAIAGKADVAHTHPYAAVEHTHSAATSSVPGFISAADKSKLDGVAEGATNYSHPNDANTRHVTDAEKTKWDAKAAADHSHNGCTAIQPNHQISYRASLVATGLFVDIFGAEEKIGSYSIQGITLPPDAKIDMPGLLRAGTVRENGFMDTYWGAKGCNSEMPDNAPGTYKITHNIGHTKYYVTLTPYKPLYGHILEKSANYVVVKFYNSGGNPINTAFDFQICGQN